MINYSKFFATVLVAVSVSMLLAVLIMDAYPEEPLLGGFVAMGLGYSLGLYVYHGWAIKNGK